MFRGVCGFCKKWVFWDYPSAAHQFCSLSCSSKDKNSRPEFRAKLYGAEARAKISKAVRVSCLERFHKQYEKTTGCWVWTGHKDPAGYGVFHFNGRLGKTHRVSYMIHTGPIPAGMFVCHHCDNPPCVNPAHLFLGTHQDNMKDMVAKGRGRSLKGGDCHFAVLTEKEVCEIRAAYIPYKVSCMALAKEYGVHEDTIYLIIKNLTWRHV